MAGKEDDIPMAITVEAEYEEPQTPQTPQTPQPVNDGTVEIPVMIPAGAGPGTVMNIQYNNQTYQIACPPGAQPGETIRARIRPQAVQSLPPPVQTYATQTITLQGTGQVSSQKLGSVRCYGVSLIIISIINVGLAWSSFQFGGGVALIIGMILNIAAGALAIQHAHPVSYQSVTAGTGLKHSYACAIAASVFVMFGVILCALTAIVTDFDCTDNFDPYNTYYYSSDYYCEEFETQVRIFGGVAAAVAFIQFSLNIGFCIDMAAVNKSTQAGPDGC